MKTLLARLFDCGDDACCFSFLKGRARHFYADDGNAGHLRLRSEPDLDSPGSNSPMVRRSRTWSASQFTKNFRHLQRMMSSPKRLKADELDFGQLSLHDRATSIMDLWKIRGQYRPITAFYDFERKLGEGAFGSVAKWRIKGSQQQVAVKRIKWRAIWHGFFRNRAAEKAIRKELKLLLVLDNPFIIKFREWFEDLFKGIFFVMELCSGPSLQSILEDVCRQPEVSRRSFLPKLRRHFREVTYAISYLHGMDPPVVHFRSKLDWSPDAATLTKARALHPIAMAAKLLAYEKSLKDSGELVEVSHKGASSILLEAKTLGFQVQSDQDASSESTETADAAPKEEIVSVYRHMTDAEAAFLYEHSLLPDTQPYQTIVVGEEGYEYCKKYFTGKKKVTPPVTTIIEFQCPKTLIDTLFAMQWKIEDGARSHGLGDKGGKGLPLFNESLAQSRASWRVVFVKRPRR